MNVDEFLAVLYPPGQLRQLTPQQTDLVRHPQGPAWVLAGPGTGKTEALTVLSLRLLYVDNDPLQQARVPPESIFITTFTEKAARNLEDRIAQMRAVVTAADPALAAIDVSKLRIGTLHGLCNDLLQELRAPNYQNLRLMDEFEQAMFMYGHMSITRQPNPQIDIPFWTDFEYLFSPRDWQRTRPYSPSKWNTTSALMQLFNRVAEDRVSVAMMRNAGGRWQRLADLYEEYVGALQINYRCDFAHLQLKFLEFLGTYLGTAFCDGDGSSINPGLQWVLVDEYQDTNPIQEEIYFRLAGRQLHNLVVVGDDDQALYRFRGGSVECMVTFDQACQVYWGINPAAVARYPLATNFRSHPQIVTFCDNYITSFPAMAAPGARAPGKLTLTSGSSIRGSYPAVGILRAPRMQNLAARVASTIADLVSNSVVSDPSQCCILLRSTRETANNAAPYVSALTNSGLQVYNPRNKAFLEQEEVMGLLGALLAILDPSGSWVPPQPQAIQELVLTFQTTFMSLAATYQPLADYVDACRASIQANPGGYIASNLQEIVYFLISLPPFGAWQSDPVRRVRLGRLTALFESFTSTPVPQFASVSRGSLKVAITGAGEINSGWLRQFYYLFVGYLSRVGLDDAEDDDVICPFGMVPVMTIHQSKGLEFPFVFVGHVGNQAQVSACHYLEAEVRAFPINAARAFPVQGAQLRADLDLIRQYYVAYSRAQYALIIMGTNQQFSSGAIPCGPAPTWLQQRVLPL